MMDTAAQIVGERAEQRVIEALKMLPSPWQYFPTVEWRTLRREGEGTGEADVVVFHPQHGVVVIEIKGGAVDIRNGVWYYASGLEMKQSPFSQARRNRYALIDKLQHRLSRSTTDALTITHAAWFPDIDWKAPFPGAEAPSKAFLLDRAALTDPESALLRMFREASPDPLMWSRSQQQALKELLAPDCHLLVPLVVKVHDSVEALHNATEQQIAVLRLLRSQTRLLVEGGAGTGKTLLACALAREHAALGKRVLLTCYNRQLAWHLNKCLEGISQIRVVNFHELVRQMLQLAGLPYEVPAESKAQALFFREGAAEQLLNASEFIDLRFDSIIIDEAADFAPTWWVALEALGAEGFSWYCFYHRQQSIYQAEAQWQPPFDAIPMTLDTNLRNPKPIGEFAVTVGQCAMPAAFRVTEGLTPIVYSSKNHAEMADLLKRVLRDLLRKEGVAPEQIVILAPYKHTNPKSGWFAGLDGVDISTNMAAPVSGKVRVGTIQGFKGLEADVVILVGIDSTASRYPELLYVGASRAKGMLYVLEGRNDLL